MKKADEIEELETRAEQIKYYMTSGYSDARGPNGSDSEELEKINARLEVLQQPSMTNRAFQTAGAVVSAVSSGITGMFRNKSNDRFEARLQKIASDNPSENHHDM